MEKNNSTENILKLCSDFRRSIYEECHDDPKYEFAHDTLKNALEYFEKMIKTIKNQSKTTYELIRKKLGSDEYQCENIIIYLNYSSSEFDRDDHMYHDVPQCKTIHYWKPINITDTLDTFRKKLAKDSDIGGMGGTNIFEHQNIEIEGLKINDRDADITGTFADILYNAIQIGSIQSNLPKDYTKIEITYNLPCTCSLC